MKAISIKYESILLELFLFFIFFNGFMSNFIVLYKLGSSILDILFLLILILFIIKLIKNNIKLNFLSILVFILIFILTLRLFIDVGSFYQKFLGFRMKMYIIIFITIQPLLENKKNLDKIVNRMHFYGIILCFYGIIQFLFRNKLSNDFLTLKGTNLFGYYGTDIIRANGLIGTPIDFGFFTLIFFVISLQLLLENKNLKYIMYTLICLFSCICTFSRVAYLGLIVFTIVILIVNIKNSVINVNNKLIFIGLFSLSFIIFMMFIHKDYIESSFIHKYIISGESVNVQSSNEGHKSMIEDSIEYIEENPIHGYGIGTQRYDTIYNPINFYNTDGIFFAFILELGIPIFILMLIIIIVSIFYSCRVFHENLCSKSICLAFILLGLYQVIFGAFINSSFFNKTAFIIYWLMLGIIMASRKIYQN